jgi:triphosphoribosyl-dephospho-CoA synthetase
MKTPLRRCSPSRAVALAAETEAAFERHHAGEATMRALPTLAARREAAREFALVAKEALELMHDRDVACDLHPEHVKLKNQAVMLLVVRGLEALCELTYSQAWDSFNADDGEDSEAA